MASRRVYNSARGVGRKDCYLEIKTQGLTEILISMSDAAQRRSGEHAAQMTIEACLESNNMKGEIGFCILITKLMNLACHI